LVDCCCWLTHRYPTLLWPSTFALILENYTCSSVLPGYVSALLTTPPIVIVCYLQARTTCSRLAQEARQSMSVFGNSTFVQCPQYHCCLSLTRHSENYQRCLIGVAVLYTTYSMNGALSSQSLQPQTNSDFSLTVEYLRNSCRPGVLLNLSVRGARRTIKSQLWQCGTPYSPPTHTAHAVLAPSVCWLCFTCLALVAYHSGSLSPSLL
jgi:hypothetical protein